MFVHKTTAARILLLGAVVLAASALLTACTGTLAPEPTTAVQQLETNTWLLVGKELSDSPVARFHSPTGRFLSSAVFDPETGKVVLFGGGALETVALNDTWAFDPATDTWTRLDPSGSPPTSYGHTLVRDDTSGRLILFAGYGSGMGETWAYEPRENRWLDLRPAGEIPPGRYGYAMTYDPASGKMLMFGGLDRQGNLLAQGAWTYDPTANRWSEVQQPYGNPDASRFASMLYVTQTDSVMFFSGTRGQEEKLRVFFRDAVTGNWRDLPAGSTSPADLGASPAPGSRSGCGVVEDSALGQVVVFGGLGLYGALDDTWCFDPGASRWVELQSPTAPPARWGAAMAYDPATDQIVLFGGFAASGSEGSAPLDDTWVLYSPRP